LNFGFSNSMLQKFRFNSRTSLKIKTADLEVRNGVSLFHFVTHSGTEVVNIVCLTFNREPCLWGRGVLREGPNLACPVEFRKADPIEDRIPPRNLSSKFPPSLYPQSKKFVKFVFVVPFFYNSKPFSLLPFALSEPTSLFRAAIGKLYSNRCLGSNYFQGTIPPHVCIETICLCIFPSAVSHIML
jgi:hypothetical protein